MSPMAKTEPYTSTREVSLLMQVAEGHQDAHSAAKLLRPTYIRNGSGASKLDQLAIETLEFYRDLYHYAGDEHETEVLEECGYELQRIWDRELNKDEVHDVDVFPVDEHGR